MKRLVIILVLLNIGTVFAQTQALTVKADSLFTFKDSRDGRSYRAFTINGVTWMGENLRHKTKHSWCYKINGGCEEYGRMYNWEEAQTACPKSWHLPTVSEWDSLVTWLGGDGKAGYALAYSDSLGFSVKFGYPPNINGRYSESNVQASYWTSNEQSASTAWVYYLIKQKLPFVYTNYFSKNYGMMCRCVQDSSGNPDPAVSAEASEGE